MSTAHLVCPAQGIRLGLGEPRRRPDGTVHGFAARPGPDFTRALWKFLAGCTTGDLALRPGDDAGGPDHAYREVGGSPEDGGIPLSDYLDATDRDRISYYALLFTGFTREHPSGLIRRRHREIGLPVDEVFTHNDRWEPNEYLARYHLGYDDIEHVEVSEAEATAFVLGALAEMWPAGG